VILRLRSVLDTISLHHRRRRVMIVAHQVVVLCLRYLLESLTEDQILAIDPRPTSPTAGSPNIASIRLRPGRRAEADALQLHRARWRRRPRR
jgi:probable phosphoglycerate mutase